MLGSAARARRHRGRRWVIRIVFIVVVAPQVPTLGDASAYHLLAENLAHGRGYIRPFDDLLLHVRRPTAEYPPLFATVLSVPARLGLHSVEQQRIFLAFVGAATVVLVGLLGRRVASGAVGLVAPRSPPSTRCSSSAKRR